jgi:3-dehydroquinate synthetase
VTLTYSVKRLGFDRDLAQSAIALCRRLAGGSFPSPPPESEAIRLLTFDKKIRNGQLKFVALKAPGQSQIENDLSPELILEAARDLLKNENLG